MNLEGIMLSEVSLSLRQILYDLTYIGILKKKKKKPECIEKEIRPVITEMEGEGRGDWRKVVNRYKLPAVR